MPNQPRARSKKPSDAEVAEPLGSLKEKEILLQASETPQREMEERYEAQIRELENRLRQLEDLVLRREAEPVFLFAHGACLSFWRADSTAASQSPQAAGSMGNPS